MKIKQKLKTMLDSLKTENNKFEVAQRKGFKKYCKQDGEVSSLLNNKGYYQSQKGKRCFVIGNGPSTKMQDLSFLKDELVITVNQASKAGFFGVVKPNFHFWADGAFLTGKLGQDLYNCMTNPLFKENQTKCFFPVLYKDFVRENQLDVHLDVGYYFPGNILFDGFNQPIDFCKYVPSCFAVVQYAILWAIYLGCTEIILLGCESSVILSDIEYYLKGESDKNYSYVITDEEKRKRIEMREKCSFESTFYGNYQTFKGFRILNEYCLNNGIRLYNATPGGLLDCIERRRLEEFYE